MWALVESMGQGSARVRAHETALHWQAHLLVVLWVWGSEPMSGLQSVLVSAALFLVGWSPAAMRASASALESVWASQEATLAWLLGPVCT